MRARAAQNDAKIRPDVPPPLMAPGAQPYWQPTFAQIQQPNAVTPSGTAPKSVNESLFHPSCMKSPIRHQLTLLTSMLRLQSSAIEVHIHILHSFGSTPA